MEVACNYDLAYNGKIYKFEEPITTENSVTVITKNVQKKNKKVGAKIFDINTNTYENLTSNKESHIVKLYDNLEEKICKKFNSIHINYLKKCVGFKTNQRLIEIYIKQKELDIVFEREAKSFDIDNLLVLRKGYENQNLCYSLKVDSDELSNYALNLFEQLYNLKTNSLRNEKIDRLVNKMNKVILSINTDVETKTTTKGYIYKTKRNFAFIEKHKYGLRLLMLKTKDECDFIEYLNVSDYQPFKTAYKITNEDDIEIVVPYLKECYKVSKINPIDYKNNLYKDYYQI